MSRIAEHPILGTPERRRLVTFSYDGRELQGYEGEPIAMALHAAGRGAKYTRSHPPRRLLGFEVHPDRSAASKAEYRVKRLSTQEKWAYAATLQSRRPG